MASDTAIGQCLAVLRGAGLPFPSDPDVALALPAGWRMTLEHVTDAALYDAVKRYLQSDPPPAWWPKSTELAALARSGTHGRAESRPDFATLRRAYFEARAHGERDVAARLPGEVRDAILARLEAAGGMAALRHAMMAQGPYELSRLEQAFNATPTGSALVRRGS